MPQKSVKKSQTKKTVKSVTKPVIDEMPLPDPYCHCTKRKRNMILTCVFVGAIIIGFVISQLFFCGCCHKKHMPRVHFVNGCVDVTTVKCPKMLENLPMMDTDNDGCITKKELRASKKNMHRHAKPASVAEPAVNVEDAIAPVVE